MGAANNLNRPICGFQDLLFIYDVPKQICNIFNLRALAATKAANSVRVQVVPLPSGKPQSSSILDIPKLR